VNLRSAEGSGSPVKDIIPIREILHAIRARWLLVTFVSAAFFGLSVYAVLQLRSLYRATVLLAPAATERSASGIGAQLSQLSGLASLVGIGIPSNSTDTEQALAVLESREFTDHFIRKWNLVEQVLPSYQDDEDVPVHKPNDVIRIPSRAIERFNKKFRHVIRDKKTGLVQIQIDWYEPVLAATLANDMVLQLNSDLRARAIHSSDESLKYLQAELPTTESIEIRQAINALIENEEKQRMVATVNEDYAFRVIDPAVPSERNRPVAPPRAAYALLGTMFGTGLGVLVAWLLERRAKRDQGRQIR
jgi:uncharacterized protein involved in exopolysaccharide biosynthesis